MSANCGESYDSHLLEVFKIINDVVKKIVNMNSIETILQRKYTGKLLHILSGHNQYLSIYAFRVLGTTLDQMTATLISHPLLLY